MKFDGVLDEKRGKKYDPSWCLKTMFNHLIVIFII